MVGVHIDLWFGGIARAGYTSGLYTEGATSARHSCPSGVATAPGPIWTCLYTGGIGRGLADEQHSFRLCSRDGEVALHAPAGCMMPAPYPMTTFSF